MGKDKLSELRDLKSFVFFQMTDTSTKGFRFRMAGFVAMGLSIVPLALVWFAPSACFDDPGYWTPRAIIAAGFPFLAFLVLWLAGRAMLATGAAYGLRSGQWTDVYAYLLSGETTSFGPDDILSAIVLTRREQAADVFVRSLPDALIDKLHKVIKKAEGQ
jgi:hypothetical protein